jgi:hypothetical protein
MPHILKSRSSGKLDLTEAPPPLQSKRLGLFTEPYGDASHWTWSWDKDHTVSLSFPEALLINGKPGPTLIIQTFRTSCLVKTDSTMMSGGIAGGILIDVNLWNGQESIYPLQIPPISVGCGEVNIERTYTFAIPYDCYDSVIALFLTFPREIIGMYC